MTKAFLDAIKNRRSHYSIGKEKIIPNDKIIEIITEAIKHSPSSFNSQSARVVVLFDKNHEKLWEITKDEIKKITPEEIFEQSKQKIDACFKSGYGTVLFFEDTEVVENLQTKFPLYKENFPIWSNQSSGMLQYIVWTALELSGLGASLQHYNPLIDEKIKKEWDIPKNYKLIVQMPFGSKIAEPDKKEFLPIVDRLRIFE